MIKSVGILIYPPKGRNYISYRFVVKSSDQTSFQRTLSLQNQYPTTFSAFCHSHEHCDSGKLKPVSIRYQRYCQDQAWFCWLPRLTITASAVVCVVLFSAVTISSLAAALSIPATGWLSVWLCYLSRKDRFIMSLAANHPFVRMPSSCASAFFRGFGFFCWIWLLSRLERQNHPDSHKRKCYVGGLFLSV